MRFAEPRGAALRRSAALVMALLAITVVLTSANPWTYVGQPTPARPEANTVLLELRIRPNSLIELQEALGVLSIREVYSHPYYLAVLPHVSYADSRRSFLTTHKKWVKNVWEEWNVRISPWYLDRKPVDPLLLNNATLPPFALRASTMEQKKLHVCILGDLAPDYDQFLPNVFQLRGNPLVTDANLLARQGDGRARAATGVHFTTLISGTVLRPLHLMEEMPHNRPKMRVGNCPVVHPNGKIPLSGVLDCIRTCRSYRSAVILFPFEMPKFTEVMINVLDDTPQYPEVIVLPKVLGDNSIESSAAVPLNKIGRRLRDRIVTVGSSTLLMKLNKVSPIDKLSTYAGDLSVILPCLRDEGRSACRASSIVAPAAQVAGAIALGMLYSDDSLSISKMREAIRSVVRKVQPKEVQRVSMAGPFDTTAYIKYYYGLHRKSWASKCCKAP